MCAECHGEFRNRSGLIVISAAPSFGIGFSIPHNPSARLAADSLRNRILRISQGDLSLLIAPLSVLACGESYDLATYD